MDKKYLQNQVSILLNLYNSQRFGDVVQKGKILIKKFPRELLFYNATALSLSSLGKKKEALSILKSALELSPTNIHVLNNLGLINLNLNKDKLSREYLEKAISINPDFMDANLNLGNLNLKEGKVKDAEKNLHKALEQSKSPATDETINMAIGNLYQQMGQFAKAMENFTIVNKINPHNTNADKSISTMHKYQNKNDPHFVKMNAKLKEIKNPDSLKSLHFALGKALEDIEEYKESFYHIKSGNKLADDQLNYNVDNDKKLFDEIKKKFEKVDITNTISSKKNIIFILGMPRSGTSLVEQIISAHRNVYGAGELNFMSECVENLVTTENHEDLKLWEKFKNLSKIDNYKLKHAQEEYVKKLEVFNHKEKYITDKAPLNFRWIGFIKLIFPNSKIIHCNRKAMDICYSNYKNSFSAGSLGFCYNLKKLGNYFNLYKDLMMFWKDMFGDQIYQLSYEKLISDKEKEIKDLLSFCELDLDEACLKHHKNAKTVATASLAQVRSPIYKSSIDKWKNIENELEDLKKVLN